MLTRLGYTTSTEIDFAPIKEKQSYELRNYSGWGGIKIGKGRVHITEADGRTSRANVD